MVVSQKANKYNESVNIWTVRDLSKPYNSTASAIMNVIFSEEQKVEEQIKCPSEVLYVV